MDYNIEIEKNLPEINIRENIKNLDKIFEKCNENLKGRISLSDSRNE